MARVSRLPGLRGTRIQAPAPRPGAGPRRRGAGPPRRRGPRGPRIPAPAGRPPPGRGAETPRPRTRSWTLARMSPRPPGPRAERDEGAVGVRRTAALVTAGVLALLTGGTGGAGGGAPGAGTPGTA